MRLILETAQMIVSLPYLLAHLSVWDAAASCTALIHGALYQKVSSYQQQYLFFSQQWVATGRVWAITSILLSRALSRAYLTSD